MKRNVLIVSMLVALVSCSEKIRVFTDADAHRDIRAYQTYKWEEIKNLEAGNNPLYYNELNDKRIKTEVNAQLSNHQYNLTDADNELIVHYHIVIKNETAYRDPSSFYHGALGIGADRSSSSFQEGTIIIDLMDAKTKDLVWRGFAISILDEYHPEFSKKKLHDAISKIFAHFPQSGTDRGK